MHTFICEVHRLSRTVSHGRKSLVDKDLSSESSKRPNFQTSDLKFYGNAISFVDGDIRRTSIDHAEGEIYPGPKVKFRVDLYRYGEDVYFPK